MWRTKEDETQRRLFKNRAERELKKILGERYKAHTMLVATGADEAELEELKVEINEILQELRDIYAD